ncbi:MAG: zinc transporter ZupT [Syntrophobacteraceae bacterium]
MNDNVPFAFMLTAIAGLSTGIGSAIAFLAKRTNKAFLSAALGFSAGVMIYVSFVEIFRKAQEQLSREFGATQGAWLTVTGFMGGMLAIAVVDRLVPSYENPHEARSFNSNPGVSDSKLERMGKFAALAIAIHNFPEGLATFVAALTDPSIGIPITFAIALHNIPEGISVSVPIYFATGSRKKAFWLSFLSGMSEPVGALIGYGILKTYFSPVVFGTVFASVAGIMVFISIDELFPTAKEYGEGHAAVYGLMGGMAVMALSLLLFL